MSDFVPYELAVKLKEKGFPQIKEKTLAMYNECGEWFSLAKNLDDFEYLFEDFDDKDCVSPTISQVLKWLREEYKLYVCPAVIADYQDDFHRDITYWSLIVINIESGDSIYREYERVVENRYDTYEQAALAGIEYVLDNLIKL